MTVIGLPPVTYAYDAADRLTSVSRDTDTVTLAYDNLDRRTSVTLPNAVTKTYTWDAASQLLGLTYSGSGGPLTGLQYRYDAAGRPVQVSGTGARVTLPAPWSGATYDAANRLTGLGAQTFGYDAEGQLLNDGTSTYSWNARHQLTGIAGPTPAAFGYDALGRRTSRVVGGAGRGYLYDGDNVLQLRDAGAAPTTLLNGPGLDEVFGRSVGTDPTVTVLSDRLGSTIGLSDGAGVGTSYSYQPFGASTEAGAASPNDIEFTGRENDGNGLQFNRARYYSPVLQRFISEDPTGFAGSGVNLYAYAGNSPTVFTDPTGATAVPLQVGGLLGRLVGLRLPGAGQTEGRGNPPLAGHGANRASAG